MRRPHAVPVVLLVFAVFSAFTSVVIVAAEERRPIPELDPDQHFDVNAYHEADGWIVSDTNGDGSIDYALKLDEDLRKVMEALDFSNDGRMDNFYFYRRDALIREEIDTNHDGRVDLWVYLEGGVYVVRWERDTNHDGYIDKVRVYR